MQLNEWVKPLVLDKKDVLIVGRDIISSITSGCNKFRHSGMSDKELGKLGKFDLIFWSDLSEEISLTKAQKIVEKGQALIDSVGQKLPNLQNIKYSDVDLETFCSAMAKESPIEVTNFLNELLEHGQITEKQYEYTVEKHQLLKKKTEKKNPINLSVKGLDIYPFLMKCLEHHLRIGGRLVGLLMSYPSLYENVPFFESVITHPSYVYEESPVEFQGQKGIFFNVLKKG